MAPRDSKLENNRNSHGWRRCNGECLISGPVTPKKKPTGFSFCWDSVEKMGEIGARFVCLLTTYCTVLSCSLCAINSVRVCVYLWTCVCISLWAFFRAWRFPYQLYPVSPKGTSTPTPPPPPLLQNNIPPRYPFKSLK